MKLSTLHEIRAWIDHWDEDRRHGLCPTEGSLAEARRQIDREIRAESLPAVAVPPELAGRNFVVYREAAE